MGKTIRRKDIKNDGYYYDQSSTRGEHTPEVADNIFHSDKPKNWKGIYPEVKNRQNEIARMEKRKIQQRVLSGGEPEYDKTDKTVRTKANTGFEYN